jgi:3D (Asp-Asp-Asp) domain-containing protein
MKEFLNGLTISLMVAFLILLFSINYKINTIIGGLATIIELEAQMLDETQPDDSNYVNPRFLLNLNQKVKELTVTAYTPTEQECDSDPLVTASMRKVRQGTIAVSRDLFYSGWVFGMKVYVEGLGVFEINDLMGKNHKQRIDVFMWEKNKAKEFGRKKLVDVAQ